jgi:hypothetical protein
MRNAQLNSTSNAVNAVTASWFVDALSTQGGVKREDVRPGIFYYGVDTARPSSKPELLSSAEAREADKAVALFMFEHQARSFQKKQKAQHQH